MSQIILFIVGVLLILSSIGLVYAEKMLCDDEGIDFHNNDDSAFVRKFCLFLIFVGAISVVVPVIEWVN